MRRYDDPVETRWGRVGDQEAPEGFRWRGRAYAVRAVLAHWIETGAWWSSPAATAVTVADAPDSPVGLAAPDLLAEREVWRVEASRAGAGAAARSGVFDLLHDETGRWQLVGCAD